MRLTYRRKTESAVGRLRRFEICPLHHGLCAAHALITEYQEGTPIGWHRDAPHFDIVVGVSQAGPCVMRFRPRGIKPDRNNVVTLELAPRSAYVMRGAIRWDWQHSIPPTKARRYSITMRTLVSAARAVTESAR